MRKEDIRVFLESKETYKKVIKILNKKVKSETKYNDLAQEELSTNRNLNDVLEDLEDGFTPFLCGGSVANALYSLLHGGEPIINDIDIFLQYEDEEEVWQQMQNLREEGEEYAFSYRQENGSSYKLLAEEKDGIINHIKCHIENSSPTTIPSKTEFESGDDGRLFSRISRPKMLPNKDYISNKQVILNGFDLNCTQSGIDMETEEIIYTEGFLDFLHTKQLKVVAPHTPMQTAIRLHKKVEDLGCYCNLELEMGFLVGAIGTGIKQTMGEITHTKYLKYKSKIDKYFLVQKLNDELISRVLKPYEEAKDNKKDSASCVFSHEIGFNGGNFYSFNKDLNKFQQEMMKWSKEVDLWAFAPIQQRDFISFKNLYTYVKYWELLNRNKTKSDLIKINLILDNIPTNTVYEIEDVGENRRVPTLTELLVGHRVEVQNYSRNPVIISLLKNNDLYKSDFTKEHVEYIYDMVKAHNRVWWKMPKTTIQDIYNRIKELKSYANKKGQWVIGEFENWSPIGTDQHYGWSNSEIEYDFNDFKMLVKMKEKEMNKPLVKPLDLSEFDYNSIVGLTLNTESIAELTSTLMLKTEGTIMGHCVGGYSHSIERGDSRIFHIECDGIGSTLQISKTIKNVWDSPIKIDGTKKEKPKSKWKVSQHYGRYPERGNLEPTGSNLGIARELVGFMNENHPIEEPHSKEKRLVERELELQERERQEQEIF